MTLPRTALAAAIATLLTLSIAACSRDVGDTDTNAAAPDPTEATADETVSPAAGVPMPASGATPDPAPPEAPGTCDADAVQALVGQEATDAVLEQAKADSGANVVRALKPGEAATMDFRPDRLDIALDDNSIILSLRCG